MIKGYHHFRKPPYKLGQMGRKKTAAWCLEVSWSNKNGWFLHNLSNTHQDLIPENEATIATATKIWIPPTDQQDGASYKLVYKPLSPPLTIANYKLLVISWLIYTVP